MEHKGDWMLKNWCFWTVVLEKTFEIPLDCNEIKPVNPKGNQSWIFIGKTDAEAEAPIFQLPDMLKSMGLQRVGPWTAACQGSLSFINSRSLLKLMSIKSVMPSNHLILCRPLLLLPSIFPRIRVFSKESVLRIRWPKHWSLSFSISPSDWQVSSLSLPYYNTNSFICIKKYFPLLSHPCTG